GSGGLRTACASFQSKVYVKIGRKNGQINQPLYETGTYWLSGTAWQGLYGWERREKKADVEAGQSTMNQLVGALQAHKEYG
ncbi:MAG: hypothetical protein AAF456_15025, partial [Planctomycetota bacterium]